MKVLLLQLFLAFSEGAGILMLVLSPHESMEDGDYDRVLMVKDRRGFWDFPFGTRERGESSKVSFLNWSFPDLDV